MFTFYDSKWELNKCLLAHFDYLKKFCRIPPVPTEGVFSGRIWCEIPEGQGKRSISILLFLKTKLLIHLNSLGGHLHSSEWQESKTFSLGGHINEAQLSLILISVLPRVSSALQTFCEWWSRCSRVILSPFPTSPLKSACHSNTCNRI